MLKHHDKGHDPRKQGDGGKGVAIANESLDRSAFKKQVLRPPHLGLSAVVSGEPRDVIRERVDGSANYGRHDELEDQPKKQARLKAAV